MTPSLGCTLDISCIYNQLNADINYGIFNMHVWFSACTYAWRRSTQWQICTQVDWEIIKILTHYPPRCLHRDLILYGLRQVRSQVQSVNQLTIAPISFCSRKKSQRYYWTPKFTLFLLTNKAVSILIYFHKNTYLLPMNYISGNDLFSQKYGCPSNQL